MRRTESGGAPCSPPDRPPRFDANSPLLSTSSLSASPTPVTRAHGMLPWNGGPVHRRGRRHLRRHRGTGAARPRPRGHPARPGTDPRAACRQHRHQQGRAHGVRPRPGLHGAHGGGSRGLAALERALGSGRHRGALPRQRRADGHPRPHGARRLRARQLPDAPGPRPPPRAHGRGHDHAPLPPPGVPDASWTASTTARVATRRAARWSPCWRVRRVPTESRCARDPG